MMKRCRASAAVSSALAIAACCANLTAQPHSAFLRLRIAISVPPATVRTSAPRPIAVLSKPVKARVFFGASRVGLAGAGCEGFGVGLRETEGGCAGFGGIAEGRDGGMEGVPGGAGGVDGPVGGVMGVDGPAGGVTGVGGVEGPVVGVEGVDGSVVGVEGPVGGVVGVSDGVGVGVAGDSRLT